MEERVPQSPPAVRISYKEDVGNVGDCRATRKLAEDKAIQEVNRAVTAWYYSR